jgi:hypothetical protein
MKILIIFYAFEPDQIAGSNIKWGLDNIQSKATATTI